MMAGLVLTKTGLRGGIWEGVLTGAGPTAPALTLRHKGDILEGLEVLEGDGESYLVRAQVPAGRISDDVQTFTIIGADDITILARFVIFAGEDLQEDLRAEVDLLRAELDLLKRAFRKHCIDTA